MLKENISSLTKINFLLAVRTIEKLGQGLNFDFTALEELVINSTQDIFTHLTLLEGKINEVETLIQSNTEISQRFTNIDNKLIALENLIKNLSTYKGQQITILAAQLSAANWGGGNPQSLAAILDGDDNTFSDWGNGYGSGNKGYFQVDLQNVIAGILELKTDIALNVGWGTNNIRYFIETSGDGQNFTYIHTKDVDMSPAGEIQLTANEFNGRYIRWGLLDMGNGAGKMRSAFLKVKI